MARRSKQRSGRFAASTDNFTFTPTPKYSDPASSPRHQQQIVHFSIWSPLRAQDTGNKSYILAFGPRFEPKTPAKIIHLSIRTPLRAQGTGNNLCILGLGPRLEPKTPATHCTSWHSDPASSPKHSNKSYILEIETFFRAEDTRNKLYILAFFFEPKTPATNRTS